MEPGVGLPAVLAVDGGGINCGPYSRSTLEGGYAQPATNTRAKEIPIRLMTGSRGFASGRKLLQPSAPRAILSEGTLKKFLGAQP